MGGWVKEKTSERISADQKPSTSKYLQIISTIIFNPFTLCTVKYRLGTTLHYYMYHLEVDDYLTGFERIEGWVGGSPEIISVKGL